MTISREIMDKLDEIKDSIALVDEKLEQHIHSVHRAFPRNDLQEPDFDGHRLYHVEKIKERRRVDDYKQSITSKILQGVVGFVLMLLGLGAMSWLKGL